MYSEYPTYYICHQHDYVGFAAFWSKLLKFEIKCLIRNSNLELYALIFERSRNIYELHEVLIAI